MNRREMMQTAAAGLVAPLTDVNPNQLPVVRFIPTESRYRRLVDTEVLQDAPYQEVVNHYGSRLVRSTKVWLNAEDRLRYGDDIFWGEVTLTQEYASGTANISRCESSVVVKIPDACGEVSASVCRDAATEVLYRERKLKNLIDDLEEDHIGIAAFRDKVRALIYKDTEKLVASLRAVAKGPQACERVLATLTEYNL